MSSATPPPDDAGTDLTDGSDPYPAESLSKTLDRFVAFNKRFVFHHDDSTHDLIALWVASTHAMNVWDWHGRIYITAPQPGCGKTTQAEVMALVSKDADQTASTSGPGLFRNISANKPTLFLDEAESQFSRNAGRDGDIVNQVINRGYKRGAVVTRSEGNQSVKHPVFAAVCIVGIDNGSLKDTTRSRCIPVQMTPGKQGERYRERLHEDFAAEMLWQFDRHGRETIALHDIPDGFGRSTDIWEALYSVAKSAGPRWVRKVERAAEVHAWPADTSESALVLAAIRDYFEASQVDRVGSTELLAHLDTLDDLPTITSTRALKRVWLRGYRTASGGEIKAHKNGAGYYEYRRADFKHAFTLWVADAA